VALHALIIERLNRHCPAMALRSNNEGTVGTGSAPHSLFQQAVEEHPSGSGVPAVKTEAELIEIGLSLRRLHGLSVGTLQSTLGKGRNPAHAGNQLVSLLA